MTVKHPIFDGEESLDETVQWVAEPHDLKDRAERLKEAFQKSPAFQVYIRESYFPKLSFKETLAQGELIVRTRKLGRWGYTPTSKFAQEIERYSDSSLILPKFRLNQLMNALDDVYGPDSAHIVAMLTGVPIMPDKINHRVVELSGVASGEA